MQIHCFPNEPEITRYLRSKLESADIELIESINFQQQTPEYILLYSPTLCNGKFVSYDLCWHKYFRLHNPATKIITATFESDNYQNHLNLLGLPDDAVSFFESSLNCAELDKPFFSGGYNMNALLNTLYAGHGVDSVEEVMGRLHSLLTQTGNHLKDGKTYEEINEGLGLSEFLPQFWNKLLRRWRYYYPFLTLTPFFPKFAQVNDLIEYLNPYFESGCTDENLFISQSCVSNITQIKTLLDDCWRYVETESK